MPHKVRPMFEQRVLQITEDIMFKWRLLVEDGRKAGHTFSQPDLIIAAAGLHQWIDHCLSQHHRLHEGSDTNIQSLG